MPFSLPKYAFFFAQSRLFLLFSGHPTFVRFFTHVLSQLFLPPTVNCPINVRTLFSKTQ